MATTRMRGLTVHDLDGQTVEPLPDRAAMSLVNANVAAPINAVIALNALSDGSTAFANGEQYAPVVQGIG